MQAAENLENFQMSEKLYLSSWENRETLPCSLFEQERSLSSVWGLCQETFLGYETFSKLIFASFSCLAPPHEEAFKWDSTPQTSSSVHEGLINISNFQHLQPPNFLMRGLRVPGRYARPLKVSKLFLLIFRRLLRSPFFALSLKMFSLEAATNLLNDTWELFLGVRW